MDFEFDIDKANALMKSEEAQKSTIELVSEFINILNSTERDEMDVWYEIVQKNDLDNEEFILFTSLAFTQVGKAYAMQALVMPSKGDISPNMTLS
jgi:hypothetical protein